MSQRIVKILLILALLGAFFLNSYNAFINGHYHRLLDGQIIFHAHPYEKQTTDSNNFPVHSHSKIQLLNYELLTTLLFAFLIVIIIFHFNFIKTNTVEIVQLLLHFFYIIRFHFRRGPPFFSFF
jgi:hypothetical protein